MDKGTGNFNDKRSELRIPRRILGSLLASVSAGVVPRSGAAYIAIGRTDEIEALAGDLERAAEGEGGMRFLIGKYGSGKSFLLQLMRAYAQEQGFVTAKLKQLLDAGNQYDEVVTVGPPIMMISEV